MVGNYNIEELNELKSSIAWNIRNYFGYINGFSNWTNKLPELINSQDSSSSALADTIRQFSDMCSALYHNKVWPLSTAAEASVNAFVEAVIANETSAQVNVDSINEDMSGIAAELDGIDF